MSERDVVIASGWLYNEGSFFLLLREFPLHAC